MEGLVDNGEEPELDALKDRKPVEIFKDRGDMFTGGSSMS